MVLETIEAFLIFIVAFAAIIAAFVLSIYSAVYFVVWLVRLLPPLVEVDNSPGFFDLTKEALKCHIERLKENRNKS